MNLPSNILDEIIQYCQAEEAILRAWLFGSFARGEGNADSDIDLLIDLDVNQRIGLRYFGWWEDLKEITGKDIDFGILDAMKPFIRERVKKDRVLIYERK